MSLKQRVLMAGLLAGALIAPVVAAATGGDPQRVTVLSASDAAAVVAAFAGGSARAADLAVRGPVDGAVNRFYQVQGAGISSNIDAHSGDVLSLVLPVTSATLASAPATAPSAKATAEQFLVGRSISTDGLTESLRLIGHGESSEYVVEWDRVVNGVVVPDLRVVGVDATTGQSFRYLYLHRAYAEPGKPAVNQAAAEALAVKLVGGSGVLVEDSQLRISFTASGSQLLVWTVSLTATVDVTPEGTLVPGHWDVEVDAATGAASITTAG